jgi:hypothetical protein
VAHSVVFPPSFRVREYVFCLVQTLEGSFRIGFLADVGMVFGGFFPIGLQYGIF